VGTPGKGGSGNEGKGHPTFANRSQPPPEVYQSLLLREMQQGQRHGNHADSHVNESVTDSFDGSGPGIAAVKQVCCCLLLFCDHKSVTNMQFIGYFSRQSRVQRPQILTPD